MNTLIRVEAEAGDAEPWFRRVEATLTRFEPESPLSQLNRSPGRWVVVPPLLYRAVRAALRAAAATGGAFDPTVLGALEAAGYSRSFELGPTEQLPPVLAGRWRDVRLAPPIRGIWLPDGVRLDLGGIGKGFAVDGALARLQDSARALVDAGGDIAVRTAPGDGPVRVEVEDPCRPDRVLAAFGLQQGAVATSSTLGRQWGPGHHHIIDPARGRPASSGVAAATVLGPSAMQAEVLAKACIVAGAERGLALVRAQGCHALLITENHQVILTQNLEEYRHDKE